MRDSRERFTLDAVSIFHPLTLFTLIKLTYKPDFISTRTSTSYVLKVSFNAIKGGLEECLCVTYETLQICYMDLNMSSW